MERHQQSDQSLSAIGGVATQQTNHDAGVRIISHNSAQELDRKTVSTTASFPLLRRLSITSLVAMLITASILVFLYRQDQFDEHENIAAQENEKTATHLTHLLNEEINALISATEGLDVQALRSNSHIGVFATTLETVREHHVAKLKIFNSSGVVVFSSVNEEIGSTSKHPDLLSKAQRGEMVHAMEFRKMLVSPSSEQHGRYIAITYLPLTQAGKHIGVMQIYADASPIIDRIFPKTITIALIVVCAFSALYAALFFSVFRADRAIAKWQKSIRDNTQKLAASEERLRGAIETSMDAVVQINAGGGIIDWNSQTEAIFGWPRAEVIGRAVHETIIPPQHREAHLQGMKHFLLTGDGPVLNKRIEIAGLHRDGHEFPIELTVAPIKIGDKYEFSAFIRDITKRKESEKIIWKQANFDALTNLPNRHMLHDRLEQEIKKAKRAGRPVALMFIDLDHFKEINDTLGHDMGDMLLIEAARRISDCVRATDIVARLGGDEFTVLLTEFDDVGSVERVATSIVRKLADPFWLKDEASYVSASLGITLYPDDADTMEGLFKNADQAMYVAKNEGRNRHSYFTSTMQEAAQAKLRLVNDLRGALGANQFLVYFQPIVELATGSIHKMEALIRWQHPERGLVGPAEFIQLAEETGLIFEIGDWVFHEAMRCTKHWRELYTPELQVSVNKSPVQFYKDGDDHSAWISYVEEMGLPGQSLAIEITEGLLLDSSASINGALLTLNNAGICISIDDFGTGYSSLSYLKKFDIDYLKIDQSFVRHLGDDDDDIVLCEAIIVMAHKLGIIVIAEGVETEQQRDLLAVAGCDYVQGYLYSKPLPADEFEDLLKHGLPL
jgi:diguanylate cyclase (GGDEF)-like protein/PAS domain S-box-containing protein